MVNFNSLPLEIISAITKHLDFGDLHTCTRVSKSFDKASTPLLWKQISIHSEYEDLDDDENSLVDLFVNGVEIAHQQRHPVGHYIRDLSLDSEYLTDAHLLRLSRHLSPHLEKLHLQSDGKDLVTDISFIPLLGQCRHLKQMELHRLNITKQSMIVLGYRCHELDSLALNYCIDLPVNILAVIPNHRNQQWKTLTIVSESQDDAGTLDQTTALDLVRFDRLTELTIEGIHQSFIVDALTTAWPCLSLFSLTGERRISFNHDRSLVMRAQTEVPDAWWMAFTRSHPGLKHLCLQNLGLKDTSLDAFGSFLPQLTHLDVTGNHHLTAHGVRQLVLRQQHGGGCPRLDTLILRYCEINANDFPQLNQPILYSGTHLISLNRYDINRLRQSAKDDEEQQ
ncbi:unnamed protein product [Absidia cylindrospora]